MRHEHPTNIVVNLRPIDQRRIAQLRERTETPLPSADIWYIHTVLTQCFLPYKDPKTDRWRRQNGKFSISLIAGDIKDPTTPEGMRVAGLPFGAKPRLFQSYLCTQAIKQQSPVIAVERSMTAMIGVCVAMERKPGKCMLRILVIGIPERTQTTLRHRL